MGKAIPAQHPAVVLRSHYRQLRALLAMTMIAVIGLTAAVVILATDDDRDTGAGSATQVIAPGPAGSTRYEHGPKKDTRGAVPAQPPTTRYDGGPEEGTRGALSSGAPSNAGPLNRYSAVPLHRYDGGPSDDSRRSGR